MYIRTDRTKKANPKLATLKDDDERQPIHWATSYNHRPIVQILISQRNFDPDVQDASGWTPLMIASSLREEDGLVDMLLSKDADVNMKNYSGQVSQLFCMPSSPSVTLLMLPNPLSASLLASLKMYNSFTNFMLVSLKPDSPPFHCLKSQPRHRTHSAIPRCFCTRKRQTRSISFTPCSGHRIGADGESVVGEQQSLECY